MPRAIYVYTYVLYSCNQPYSACIYIYTYIHASVWTLRPFTIFGDAVIPTVWVGTSSIEKGGDLLYRLAIPICTSLRGHHSAWEEAAVHGSESPVKGPEHLQLPGHWRKTWQYMRREQLKSSGTRRVSPVGMEMQLRLRSTLNLQDTGNKRWHTTNATYVDPNCRQSSLGRSPFCDVPETGMDITWRRGAKAARPPQATPRTTTADRNVRVHDEVLQADQAQEEWDNEWLHHSQGRSLCPGMSDLGPRPEEVLAPGG